MKYSLSAVEWGVLTALGAFVGVAIIGYSFEKPAPVKLESALVQDDFAWVAPMTRSVAACGHEMAKQGRTRREAVERCSISVPVNEMQPKGMSGHD